MSSRPTLGTVRFQSLGNFVYPTLPQSTQLQMSTNTVWKVPAMDQCPVQESQYNCTLSCFALQKPGLSTGHISLYGFLRRNAWGMTLPYPPTQVVYTRYQKGEALGTRPHHKPLTDDYDNKNHIIKYAYYCITSPDI